MFTQLSARSISASNPSVRKNVVQYVCIYIFLYSCLGMLYTRTCNRYRRTRIYIGLNCIEHQIIYYLGKGGSDVHQHNVYYGCHIFNAQGARTVAAGVGPQISQVLSINRQPLVCSFRSCTSRILQRSLAVQQEQLPENDEMIIPENTLQEGIMERNMNDDNLGSHAYAAASRETSV